jgi:DNA (cytosine-5)-methyltransferase 1
VGGLLICVIVPLLQWFGFKSEIMPLNNPHRELRALSFFSGAMGLDLGLERAGLHMRLACEKDKACRKTIAANRPDLPLLGDIDEYSASNIREAAGLKIGDEIDLIVGGPPCQAFSTAGARRGFKDERGNVFLKYIDLSLELAPRYIIIENVRGLLSAPLNHRPHAQRDDGWLPAMDEKPGGALFFIMKRLRSAGYGVSFNLYNSANYGVPQVRERVILICHREGEILPHLMPTHSDKSEFGLPQWRTLRDAIAGLNSATHLDFPEARLRFYRMLREGEYWKHLPVQLQHEALGNAYFSGGGKTGFLRRLAWDKPSCTLVTSPTMPATDICHPQEDRPLSVEEYKRIQQFPDDWAIQGSLIDQYRQIGNAVPVGLGEAVGRCIIDHMLGKVARPPAGFPFSRYRDNDHQSWEARVSAVMVPSIMPNLNHSEYQGKKKGAGKPAPYKICSVGTRSPVYFAPTTWPLAALPDPTFSYENASYLWTARCKCSP